MYKDHIIKFYEVIDRKALKQFGFHIKDISIENITDYFYTPIDPSSLAITRILFGLCMLCDILEERGGSVMEKRWGNPKTCHFPLLPFIEAIPMPYMAAVYALLWTGAVGMTFGYKYRISALMFTISYWYLFLIEKSYWNNHTYLFGLVAFLLCFTQANCYWSLDAYFNPKITRTKVPYWNYFVLKYQFFILYFMAGLKKGTAEWLSGYSVPKLSQHWVFEPLKLLLTGSQIDYLIVHWFVFIFDLTVAFWMMWSYTRPIATIFCALFHLMNSRLFKIGMFPWVCLVTMPLFYSFDWPKRTLMFFKLKFITEKKINHVKNKSFKIINELDDENKSNENEKLTSKDLDKNINEITKEYTSDIQNTDVNETNKDMTSGTMIKDMRIVQRKKRLTTYIIILYVLVQAFLPYSHFITKGYNNWTDGLYGYSWDMMVHTWDTQSVIIKVIDKDKNVEYYIEPSLYTPNDRWTRHGDMIYQYAKCLKENLAVYNVQNISVHIDVWCSLNGRFVQRMFDPKLDMLKMSWSPFKEISYLMPLIEDAAEWRSTLDILREEIHSWHNYSDVVFFADFPGYYQEKFIPIDLKNVSLATLKGKVIYEPQPINNIGHSYLLLTGNNMKVNSDNYHKVINIGRQLTFYMYTFTNETDLPQLANVEESKYKLPTVSEMYQRLYNFFNFQYLLINSVVKICFDIFTQLIKLFKCIKIHLRDLV